MTESLDDWVTGWLSHWMTESLDDWFIRWPSHWVTDYWHILTPTDTNWHILTTNHYYKTKFTKVDKTTKTTNTNSETKKRSCYERLKQKAKRTNNKKNERGRTCFTFVNFLKYVQIKCSNNRKLIRLLRPSQAEEFDLLQNILGLVRQRNLFCFKTF